MGRRILRRVLRGIGFLLIMLGIVPLTPLIWLLVFVHAPMPIEFRLPFWATQAIGAMLAICGTALLYLTRRRR